MNDPQVSSAADSPALAGPAPVIERHPLELDPPEPRPAERRAPDPRRVPLPFGGEALMFTREQLVYLYRCSHGELGRLLRAKLAPLPIRIDGGIFWFVDEVLKTQATIERTLNRWRQR